MSYGLRKCSLIIIVQQRAEYFYPTVDNMQDMLIIRNISLTLQRRQ